jgi:hypothetical protein
VPLTDEPLEASNVELVIGHAKQVTAGLAKEHTAAGTTGPGGLQNLAEARHVDLQGVHGGSRNLIAPQQVSETIGRYRLVGMQQQEGQHGPLLAAAQSQLP